MNIALLKNIVVLSAIGAPAIMAFVAACVEYIKKLGVTGKWLLLASMLTGLIVGVLYQMAVAMPTDYSGWFYAVLYGIALGLTVSGVYDAAKSSTQKGAADVLGSDDKGKG